jgi:hypothetical protein
MAHMSDEVVAACGSIVAELAPGQLGDRRLDARRDRVVAMLEQHPDLGFPDACVDDAATEALYRFLRNQRVGWEAILAPHVAATQARCAAVGEVLVIHDTTDMVFPGAAPRAGLTRLGPARHGFWVHTALAVSADGLRAPLGILALHPIVRPTPGRGPRPPKNDRVRFADATKESRCWADGVAAVRAGLDPTRVLHVMDRGADSYELFAAWVAQHDRFLVRLTHDRRVASATGSGHRLSEAVAHAPVVCTRTVPLTARRDHHRTLSARTLHPARPERVATLQISAERITLRRPTHVDTAMAPTLPVHVVVVTEVAPPSDTPPVAWRLVTTEPIDTPAQIEQIVDAYRTRWMIEEYFKALKTGCAYEKRQLESLHTLLVALALLAPIAWRLLLIRHLAREASSPPATAALTSQQIEVLRRTPPGAKLPPQPTVRDVALALARLGGHLRQNGPPGWLTLARGFQKLCHIEQGWVAAMTEQEKM